MVFARRSLRGVATAARSFRSAPVTRPGQALGRRFYASGKGHEEHASSDLPWYVQLLCNCNQSDFLNQISSPCE